MISPTFAFWGLWRCQTETPQTQTISSRHSHIHQLPNDVLALIFKRCDLYEKYCLTKTYRRFKQVLRTPAYFGGLDFSSKNLRAVLYLEPSLFGEERKQAIVKDAYGETVSCYIPKTGEVVTAPVNYEAIGKIYSFGGLSPLPISLCVINQIHFDSEKNRLLFCGRHRDITLCDTLTGKVCGNITTQMEVTHVKMTHGKTYFTVGKTLNLLKDKIAEVVHTFSEFPSDLFFSKNGDWIVQIDNKLLLQNGVIIPLKYGSQVRQVASRDWLVVADPQELRVFHATTGREIVQHSTTALLPHVAETVMGLGKCEKTGRVLISFENTDDQERKRCYVVVWDPNQERILSTFAADVGRADLHFDVRQLESIPELDYIVTRSMMGIQVWNLEGRLLKDFNLDEYIQHFYLNLERRELIALMNHSRRTIAQRFHW